MKNVAHILRSKSDPTVHTLVSTASMFDAVKLMAEKDVGALLIMDGETIVECQRVAGFGMEKVALEIEGIGQAVGRVDAHDQRAVAEPRKLQARGSGKTGFPDASFAAEEKDAHTSF